MDRFSLKGRTALITGGARGCGLAFAEGLAEAGADVAIFDVVAPVEAFFTIEKRFGVKTSHYHVDVSSIESLEKGFAEFSKDFEGKLDICVPCAGINKNVGFLDTSFEEHQKLIGVNVMGVYHTAQLAAKQMIANGTKKGSIVLVASIASFMAIRSQMSSAYCGTKGAVRAMCPAIAAELNKYGIRVNSISPGYVRTEMTSPFAHLLESWKDEIMNRRVAEPDDIRGGCVFLASDASSYMTGQDLCIDGTPSLISPQCRKYGTTTIHFQRPSPDLRSLGLAVLAARPASNGEVVMALAPFFPARFDEHFLARSALSIMSPGMDNEGFVDVPDHNGNTEMTNGVNGDTADHVIVVGAGPAGLMLASNLVRYGIRTTIIDDRPDKTSTGRADGLQPKTIETFKQLGLAGPLLQKGAKIYDICFWSASASSPLRRIGREIHYPPEVVDVMEPFILLVHQGMVEQVFLDDLHVRGVDVVRSTQFTRYALTKSGVHIECNDLTTGDSKSLASQFMVGCDGAHSRVRKSMIGAEFDGETGASLWGVLDGVIDTDFPDLWSKAVIGSENAGSILCIPREKNMTRLYIELHPGTAPISSEAATEEFVMSRAKEIIKPFKLSWKTVEWFGIYKVGQRVANQFSDSEKVFIAGDAAHSHSPKAAQGMNVGMHDAFNLSWKLNLTIRGIAKPALLETYEQERRKIAKDLINFDYGHANAFAANDPKKLAENFATNIRFISGVGAEYADNVLNLSEKMYRGGLRAGSLLLPAQVTRYIDANPVDLQLEIPMLGQFRLFFFTHNVKKASKFLTKVCEAAISPETVMGRVSEAAAISYSELSQPMTELDAFFQPQRYTPVSKIFTFAVVTTMAKPRVEISDLPPALQDSRWTFYLDNMMRMPTCTEKWLGGLAASEVAIVNVRPDGYVGSIGRWNAAEASAGKEAVKWLDAYYGAFLKG